MSSTIEESSSSTATATAAASASAVNDTDNEDEEEDEEDEEEKNEEDEDEEEEEEEEDVGGYWLSKLSAVAFLSIDRGCTLTQECPNRLDGAVPVAWVALDQEFDAQS